ncbi:MAG: hypothetical protein KJZ87_18470 [Thermoguttaceae bacterium]|nr:hypothetical protein [Thermoguttaceae bacterium]
MADGRQRAAWNHTAQVLAMLYNAYRDRRTKALAPSDFHPYLKKPVPTVTLKQLVEMGVLKPPKE